MRTFSFTTENKANVVINSAPFIEAVALKSAISRTLAKDAKFDIDLKSLKAKSAKGIDIDFNKFLSAGLSIDGSPEVNAALFVCLARCTYNDVKITEKMFDTTETAQEDYYEILLACAKVNLTPFFKGLVSRLSGIGEKIESSNTQK